MTPECIEKYVRYVWAGVIALCQLSRRLVVQFVSNDKLEVITLQNWDLRTVDQQERGYSVLSFLNPRLPL